MRLRVISTRPSSEMSNTWVRVLSRASASRKTLMTSSRLSRISMSMKSMTMMPPMSRSRSCLAISIGGLEVVAEDGLLEARRADVLAGVDVDHGERLGVLDDERAARRQPHLAVERLVELLVDVVALEQRQRLGLAGRSTATRSASAGRDGCDVVAHLLVELRGRR